MNLEHDIYYTWLDEDDEQVSPSHKTFAAALGWISDWRKNWDRLHERRVEAEAALNEHAGPNQWWRTEQLKKIEKSLTKLSKTGKFPVRLVKVVSTPTILPVADSEETVVMKALEEIHRGG